jgi:ribonuclease R
VDGLIRYEHLMDDWWDVDERGGFVRGQRSGTRIGIGDVVKVAIVRVDMPRRELDLAITELRGRSRPATGGESHPGGGGGGKAPKQRGKTPKGRDKGKSRNARGGGRPGGGGPVGGGGRAGHKPQQQQPRQGRGRRRGR